MLTWVILSSIAMSLGVFITWLVHGRGSMEITVEPGCLLSEPTTGEVPLISVIIPARNERRNIQRCVMALSRQSYPRYEMIVVNDRSDDGTAGLLDQLAKQVRGLKTIEGAELPPGWAGKPHALVQGTEVAGGEWLCFIDADTFAGPDLLLCTYLQAVKNHADMFSILTRQELGSFWERTILPLVFLGLSYGFPAKAVNDPAKPDAISNGQFILIKRSVYDKVDGHNSVKDRVDEDRAFARVVKRAGFRLLLADGRRLASTRMYTSLAEMWEGWTKNIYLGLRDRLWLLSFGALLGVTVSIVLPAWLIGGVAWAASGGGTYASVVTAEAMLLWVYLVWKRLAACRYFEIPAGYALTFPLGAMLFTAMMGASAFKVVSGGGVEWKGRRYH